MEEQQLRQLRYSMSYSVPAVLEEGTAPKKISPKARLLVAGDEAPMSQKYTKFVLLRR